MDNKNLRGPADDSRVNIHQDYEVSYWCKKFGCTEAQLAAAVKAVGVMVADVKKRLGK